MSARPPSFRAVAAFEAAARTGSFTRAAAELNLTPGAISHAIRGLEDRLGGRLFNRSSRSVTLTPKGQDFAARVRLGLALLTDAMEPQRRGSAEELTIATTPSIAHKLLIPRIAALHAAFPGLRISLKLGDALEDVSGNGVDMAVRFGPGEWAGLASRTVAREWLTPMCSPDYRGGNLPSSLDDLRECNLIGHPASSWRLWLGPRGAEERDFASNLRIDDGAAVLDAAVRGLGVALGRIFLASAELATGRLVRPIAGVVAAEYVYATAWSPHSPKRMLVQRLSDWLAEDFEKALMPGTLVEDRSSAGLAQP